MLSVITLNFELGNVHASAVTDTLMGTQYYTFAGYFSIFSVLALRSRDGWYYSNNDRKDSQEVRNSKTSRTQSQSAEAFLPEHIRKKYKLVRRKSKRKDAIMWLLFFMLVGTFVGTISLPLAKFDYSGLEQDLMDEQSIEVTVWSLPATVYTATTTPWIAVLDSGTFYINALFCPFVCTGLVWKLLLKKKRRNFKLYKRTSSRSTKP